MSALAATGPRRPRRVTTTPRRRREGAATIPGAAFDRLLGVALAAAVLALGVAVCALAA